MWLSDDQIRRIAKLARIAIRADESAPVRDRLNRVLGLIDEMRQANTTGIEPMSHPSDMTQRLRADEVTEPDLHKDFQKVAPAVEEGLYLVPKVIE